MCLPGGGKYSTFTTDTFMWIVRVTHGWWWQSYGWYIAKKCCRHDETSSDPPPKKIPLCRATWKEHGRRECVSHGCDSYSLREDDKAARVKYGMVLITLHSHTKHSDRRRTLTGFIAVVTPGAREEGSICLSR